MSVVTNFSPLLFMTFRNMYGISFSLLGLLVLVNYVTQLSVDLIFSFFSHKFNIEKTVKFTPVLTAIGLVFYAVYPFVFPNSVYYMFFRSGMPFVIPGVPQFITLSVFAVLVLALLSFLCDIKGSLALLRNRTAIKDS